VTENTGRARRAFLFGLREDGSPTCHPMAALEKGGAPVFNTYRKSAKARNFLRDSRAAVVLLENWHTPPSRAQVLTGVLEEIDAIDLPPFATGVDAAELRGVPQRVAQRAQQRLAAGKRVYFRLLKRA
jgi:hypothetical protein